MSRQQPETEADLQGFVGDRVPESLHLDYKRSDALRKTDKDRRELAKDVAAFATAEGGMLVYGIAENPDSHEAESLDGGADPTVISKEWVEQVVDSNVSPRIDGIRITAIELTSTSAGRYAYVIHVPASDRAPHMVDNRYYMRQNFQSVAMEDYQVRDVLFRRRAPRLELLPFVTKVGEDFSLKFRVRNSGLVAAENLYLELEFARSHISPPAWTLLDRPPSVFWRRPSARGRTTDILCYIQSDAPAARNQPEPKRLPALIYPGVEVELEELSVLVQPYADPSAVITARLHARDMPVVEKRFTVQWVFASSML